MRLKFFLGTFLVLMISCVSLFAQSLPCGGDDPDAYCPLDTWVIVLATAALIFATIHLYSKQTSLKNRSI